MPLTSAPRGDRERVEEAVRERPDRLRVRRGGDVQPRRRRAEPSRSARARPRRRSGSSIRAGRRESALRQSLVPSLLAARRHNEAHGNPDAELFEIANVYLPRPGAGPARRADPAGAGQRAATSSGSRGWSRRCSAGSTPGATWRSGPRTSRSSRRAGRPSCCWGGRTWATSARSTARGSTRCELRGACTAAELDFGVLTGPGRARPAAPALPPFPAVARDLSLVVPVALPWSELAGVVRRRPGRAGGGRLPRHLPRRQRPRGTSRASTSASGSATPSGP